MPDKTQRGTLTKHQGRLEPAWKWIWDPGAHDKFIIRITQTEKIAEQSRGVEAQDTHRALTLFPQSTLIPATPTLEKGALTDTEHGSNTRAHILTHPLNERHGLVRVNSPQLVKKNLKGVRYQNLSFQT